MRKLNLAIWEKDEYKYPMAFGFVPNITAYLHEEDEEIRPGIIVVPGGGYCVVSPTESEIVAKKFYEMGYQTFVLTYTTNLLMAAPLMEQPMKDLSRAIRIVRSSAEKYRINPDKLVVCGFSAGAHLCGSVCVHYEDINDDSELYQKFSNRPDAAILSYPVITSGEHAHQDSFKALLGQNIYETDENGLLEYMSLEKHVSPDTPPCFLWQTATDELVPVENSALFAAACKKQGVPFAYHVFSNGRHGLSLADEIWASGQFGEPYTMAQTIAVVEAVKSGTIPVPEDVKAMLLAQFDFTDENREVPKEETLPEVVVWTELAEQWLSVLKY